MHNYPGDVSREEFGIIHQGLEPVRKTTKPINMIGAIFLRRFACSKKRMLFVIF